MFGLKQGFHPMQRTQRKERKKRNLMTSLLDKPITAASATAYAAGTLQGCGRRAIKYEIIEIIFFA